MMKNGYRLLILFLSAVMMSVITGCIDTKTIAKDDLHAGITETANKYSTEDLIALPGIVKIPITRKADYFSVNIDKANISKGPDQQVAIEFDHPVPFKEVLRAVAKQLGANIVFSYLPKTATNTSSVQYTRQPATTTNLATSKVEQTNTADTPDKHIEYFERPISISYRGGVKGLFDILANSTGYFFTFSNNNLLVNERQTFKIMIPNYPGIIKEIENSLVKQGATNVAVDEISNNITFSANYPVYQRIVAFADDIRNNLALITMRIVVLNVSLTGEDNAGIDWSKLVAGVRGQAQNQGGNAFGLPGLNQSTNTTTSSSGTTTTTSSSAGSFAASGVGLLATQEGMNVYLQGAKFTVSAFANMLQTYGKTNILQDINLQTLSGTKAALKSMTLTPYVDNVGINSLSNNSAATTSAATTAKAKDGLELVITPKYSRDEGTLTIGMALGIYGTGQFIQLQAGTLGSFSQPIETEKKIDNVLRMSPYQLSITGGLIFEKKIDGTNGFGLNTVLTDAQKKTISKEELIIIVKPQVYIFEPQDN